MAKVKAKKLVKSSSIVSSIQGAIISLASAKIDAKNSVDSLTIDRKKLLAENKRLTKKRTVLSKKKTMASKRLKKAPGSDTRKTLSVVSKELESVRKAGEKAKAVYAANNQELNLLKSSFKQASSYMASIEKADKVLNKPKKKRSKKRAKKPASELVVTPEM